MWYFYTVHTLNSDSKKFQTTQKKMFTMAVKRLGLNDEISLALANLL